MIAGNDRFEQLVFYFENGLFGRLLTLADGCETNEKYNQKISAFHGVWCLNKGTVLSSGAPVNSDEHTLVLNKGSKWLSGYDFIDLFAFVNR